MYNTTAAVKAALGSSVLLLRLVLSDSSVIDDTLSNLSYSAGCCDGDIGIGSVSAASLSGSIHGVLNLLGVTFTAQVGVDVEGATQWLNLGTFTVTECSRTDDATTFTAYDAAYTAFGAVYTPTVQSGATVYAVLEDIADQCGLDVEQTTLNYGLQIPVVGTLTGHTCREMVGYLAALCGKNAVISRDGFLRFVFVNPTEQTVTADDYYSGAMSNGGISKLWGLSCTVPGQEEEQTLTVGDAEKAVTVSCPYMTQAQLNAIWSTIGGYEYPVCNVSFYRGLLTEPGDVVSLTNLAGVTISFPAMQVSLEIDGGCRCTISSFGKSEAVRISGTAGPTEKRLQSVQKTAIRAMTSANGKNKVFHQASAPAASEGLTVGDLWFNTALGNQIATWDGNQWSAFSLQDAAISNLDAGSITAGTLNAAHIDVSGIFSQYIFASGTIRGAVLTTGDYFYVNRDGNMTAEMATIVSGSIAKSRAEQLLFYIPSAHSGTGLEPQEVEPEPDSGEEEGPEADPEWDDNEAVAIPDLNSPGPGYDPDHTDAVYTMYTGENGGLYISRATLLSVLSSGASPSQVISNIDVITPIVRFYATYDSTTGYKGAVDVESLNLSGNLTKNGNPYLKTASRGISYSCAAGRTGGGTFTFGTDISDETGYSPICIVGYTTGNNDVVLTRLYLGNNNTQLNFTVRNIGSSTVSGTLNVVFLFQAN